MEKKNDIKKFVLQLAERFIYDDDNRKNNLLKLVDILLRGKRWYEAVYNFYLYTNWNTRAFGIYEEEKDRMDDLIKYIKSIITFAIYEVRPSL